MLNSYLLEKYLLTIEKYKRNLKTISSIKEENKKKKEEYKEALKAFKAYAKEVKEQNKLLEKEAKDKYKKALALWKEEVKKVQAENKETLKAFKKALEAAPEEMRAFMQEPQPKPLPPKPKKEEPVLMEIDESRKPLEPRFQEIPEVKLEISEFEYGWQVFRRAEVFRIMDGEEPLFWFFKKRPERLQWSKIKAVETAEIKDISLEEFMEFFNKNNIDSLKEGLKQDLNIESISFIAFLDRELDLLFSEDTEGVKEVNLPPLAPIKPMHAASMLAGGIGEFSKEILLDGEKTLIKAAIVKDYQSRIVIKDNKEVEEVVETFNQKLGVYNIERRELKILG